MVLLLTSSVIGSCSQDFIELRCQLPIRTLHLFSSYKEVSILPQTDTADAEVSCGLLLLLVLLLLICRLERLIMADYDMSSFLQAQLRLTLRSSWKRLQVVMLIAAAVYVIYPFQVSINLGASCQNVLSGLVSSAFSFYLFA